MTGSYYKLLMQSIVESSLLSKKISLFCICEILNIVNPTFISIIKWNHINYERYQLSAGRRYSATLKHSFTKLTPKKFINRVTIAGPVLCIAVQHYIELFYPIFIAIPIVKMPFKRKGFETLSDTRNFLKTISQNNQFF